MDRSHKERTGQDRTGRDRGTKYSIGNCRTGFDKNRTEQVQICHDRAGQGRSGRID